MVNSVQTIMYACNPLPHRWESTRQNTSKLLRSRLEWVSPFLSRNSASAYYRGILSCKLFFALLQVARAGVGLIAQPFLYSEVLWIKEDT